MNNKNNPHIGSSLEDFLEEEGINIEAPKTRPMKVKDLIEQLMGLDLEMPIASHNWYPEYCSGDFYPYEHFTTEVLKLSEDKEIMGALKRSEDGKEYLIL